MKRYQGYGFLSNCRTSALEKDGDIEWFPAPRFDSKTTFASMLGKDAGNFSIKPSGKFSVTSSYLGNSLALNSIFKTSKGSLSLTDFMPLNLPAIFRLYDSKVDFTAEIDPMFNYGREKTSIDTTGSWIIFRNPKSNEGLEVKVSGAYKLEDNKLHFDKGKGYLLAFYSEDLRQGMSKNKEVTIPDPYRSLDIARDYFEHYVGKAWKVSKFKDAYNRSIAVLIGCTYMPSGAIIAAPTTSIPEIIRGQRNWDYRYSWIRDSSYAAEALAKAGLTATSRKILTFLTSLIDSSSKSFIHPFYSIDGGNPQPEEILDWMEGYLGSKPVRVGNGAFMQLQMDSEGSFLSALYTYFRESKDKEFVDENWWAINAIASFVERSWPEESSSLWEEREELQHFVHSKLMEWVAMDRASRLALVLGKNAEAKKYRDVARKIKEDILKNGFSKKENSFVKFYGSSDVDAALMDLPLYGFISARDPKFVSTLEKIINDLSIGNGMFIRYKSDAMGKIENPFTLLSFWLARIYLRMGRDKEAMDIVKHMVSCSTGLGLMAEHAVVGTYEPTGNFPQVFPHAGLIETLAEYDYKRLMKLE